MMIQSNQSMLKKPLLIIFLFSIVTHVSGFDSPLIDSVKSSTHIMFDLGMGAGTVSQAPSTLLRFGFSVVGKKWGGGARFLSLSGETGVDDGWFGPPQESFTEKAILAYRSYPVFKNHEALFGAGVGVMDGRVLTNDEHGTTSMGSSSGFAFEAGIGNHSRGVGYRVTANGNLNGVRNYFGIVFSLIFILR